MPISIQQIVVEKLGPLVGRTLDFGRLNLIYGPNETGKTYLVELVIRSLFRHAGEWPLRAELGQGKVTLHGFAEGERVFMPDSRSKLEDYWEQNGAGLPTNMARLLVVRGAEPALTEDHRTGLNRAVLKAALSAEPLIDRILEGIQATVREAELQDGRIEGAQRGELKTRSELTADLERLHDLAEQVDRRYSGGRLRSLELQRQELREELAEQLAAKQHAAFLLQQEREQLRLKLTSLPVERLEQLERDLARHQDKQQELAGLQEKWAQAKAEAEHYPWLREALELWESQRLESVGRRGVLLAVAAAGLAILGLLLSLALAALNFTPTASLVVGIASLTFFGFGMGLWAIYVVRTREQGAGALDLEQRREIEEEYRRRFGRPPGGLAGLKAQRQALLEKHARYTGLTETIEASEAEIERLAGSIERLLAELGAGEVDPSDWGAVTKRMRGWEKSLTEQLHELELRMERLDVDESDFRPEPTDHEYSAERLREIERELGRVEREHESASEDLDRLKQELARETGDELRAPWEQLLESLRQRREQVEADYRRVTARVLGQIGVVQVLERLRQEEDLKIRQELQAPEVADLLYTVTGKYRALDFVKGELIALSETADYQLADLSTGAREQVLLALRMGFASRLAGGEPLFLLLDDAFQHSDYERRERLVEEVVKLVEAGWQVTYLTMDDHLSDLFHRVGKGKFGDEYRQHVLEL